MIDTYILDYLEALQEIGCKLTPRSIKVRLPSKDIYITQDYNLLDILLYPNNIIKICNDLHTYPPIKFVSKYKTQACRNCKIISEKYCLCEKCEDLFFIIGKNCITKAFLEANKDSYFKESIHDLVESNFFREFLNEDQQDHKSYTYNELNKVIKKLFKL